MKYEANFNKSAWGQFIELNMADNCIFYKILDQIRDGEHDTAPPKKIPKKENYHVLFLCGPFPEQNVRKNEFLAVYNTVPLSKINTTIAFSEAWLSERTNQPLKTLSREGLIGPISIHR